MYSIVHGTGTPKDRASYILFEYIDPAEVGADISLAEVEKNHQCIASTLPVGF
jgi:hypothetical protein